MPEDRGNAVAAEVLIRAHGLPLSDEEALMLSAVGQLLRAMTDGLYAAELAEEI